MTDLARLTTLRLGGPAGEVVEAVTEDEVVAALRHDGPLLVVGGGSNLVVADAGFPGRVLLVRTRGVREVAADPGHVTLRVAAGEPWADLVDAAVDRGLAGLECLAGIPGSTGATPVQNVGAYGQEVADTLSSVRVWDGAGVVELDRRDCGFGYRTSRFKREPGRFVVLSVDFRLRAGPESEPLRYAELARALGVQPGERRPLRVVADTVVALRRRKGMVLDDADPDTRSAGSFFTNPVLDPASVPAGAPAWPQPDGRVKTSAAWLIERAGFSRGWGDGAAGISTKHTLALVNRGGASTAELLAVARAVRDGVRDRFGVTLEPEPQLVGCRLDDAGGSAGTARRGPVPSAVPRPA